MPESLLIKNCIAVTPDGRTPCSILAEGGKISALLSPPQCPPADIIIEANNRYVIPGVIDTHVHLGTGDQGFAGDCITESRSAVTGGVTTMMQYLIYSGSLLEVFDNYKNDVEKNSLIDVAFHIMLFNDKQLAELDEYIRHLHVTSFKFLMSLSL